MRELQMNEIGVVSGGTAVTDPWSDNDPYGMNAPFTNPIDELTQFVAPLVVVAIAAVSSAATALLGYFVGSSTSSAQTATITTTNTSANGTSTQTQSCTIGNATTSTGKP